MNSQEMREVLVRQCQELKDKKNSVPQIAQKLYLNERDVRQLLGEDPVNR